jgi:hypothetical protein
MKTVAPGQKDSRWLKFAIWMVPLSTVLGLILFVANYGMKSRSVQVIRPSHFERPGELGFWAYRQLRQRLFTFDLIIFGYDPRSQAHDDVLRAFVKTAALDGQKFDYLISTKSLELEGMTTIKLEETADSLSLQNALEKNLKSGAKAIVYLQSQLSSRLIESSFSNRLEKEEGRKFASISMLDRSQEDLNTLRESEICSEDVKYDTAEKLACYYLVQKNKLEKQLEGQKPEFVAGSLQLTKQDDYLLFIYRK